MGDPGGFAAMRELTRAEVIEALEYLISEDCCDTQHDYIREIERAIELLRRDAEGIRSFRVIDTKTGKEADTYEIALHEDWAKHLIYCDIDGWALGDDGSLMLIDDCGRFAYADRERFKVVWDDEE